MTSQIVEFIQGVAILLLAIICLIQDRTIRRMIWHEAFRQAASVNSEALESLKRAEEALEGK